MCSSGQEVSDTIRTFDLAFTMGPVRLFFGAALYRVFRLYKFNPWYVAYQSRRRVQLIIHQHNWTISEQAAFRIRHENGETWCSGKTQEEALMKFNLSKYKSKIISVDKQGNIIV